MGANKNMYLTVDCAKLNEDYVTFYEFIERNGDNNRQEYLEKKISEIITITSNLFIIYYDSTNDGIHNISVFDYSTNEFLFENGEFEDFQSWYIQQNGPSHQSDNYSKEFGNISNGGDPFVEKLLSKLVGIDLTDDINGRDLIIPALRNQQTHFFDFDLINISSRINIEFLKNDSHIKKLNGSQGWELKNQETHPNRYWWKNSRKFLTLWNACNIIGTKLYLVGYSDDYSELLHVSEIREMTSEGITSDIGYLLDYDNFEQWLFLVENSVEEGERFLSEGGFPCLIRDEEFWNRDKNKWKQYLKTFRRTQ